MIQKRCAQKFLYFEADYVEGLAIDFVGLGQDRNAPVDSEQLQYVEMLAGLGFDRFVSSDHEQKKIDSADSSQHVAHKALVAGDIDETNLQSPTIGRRQGHVGKAEIDSDAATLFFGETIGVDAGEGLDQRGLAVIDMAGGANDDRFHLSES